MSLTARDLNAVLWAAADEMRQVMSADVYKDYLLGLVFYKALSDKILVEAYELLNDEKPESLEAAQTAYEEAGDDEETWVDLNFTACRVPINIFATAIRSMPTGRRTSRRTSMPW